MAYIIVSVALAAMIGSGASFLAQTALPGELLWVFKVHINERFQSLFAEQGKARAFFELSAIEARLREGVLLDIRRSLDPADITRIEEDITRHAEQIERDIRQMLTDGKYQAATDLATEFQALLVKNVLGTINTEALLERASQLSAEASAKLQ